MCNVEKKITVLIEKKTKIEILQSNVVNITFQFD